MGFLLDDGGDDDYRCEGEVRYEAPQTPGEANSSFCQGASLGFLSEDPQLSLAGGLGFLLDQGGDDHYRAHVYGQGVGYWYGAGVLHDGRGADRYDGVWYTQGAGVHRGAGLLWDEGPGADQFGVEEAPWHAAMGVGHDEGVGALLNLGVDADQYRAASLGLGAGRCGGLGLYVDAGGQDLYELANNSAGFALSEGCGSTRLTLGMALDAGGGAPDLLPQMPEGVRIRTGTTALGLGLDRDLASGF